MKSLLQVLIIPILLLTGMSSAEAESKVSVNGEVRLRTQLDDKSFDSTAAKNAFGELRTRVGIKALVNDNAHAFVQIQDSRIIGGRNQFGKAPSGTLEDSKNIDIHQAYLQIDNLFGKGWGAKAGRFEFNRGNQRIFGAVGWHNVGRAWEGYTLWYSQEKFTFTAFHLKALELQDPGYNRDFDIYGGYINIKALKRGKLDLFAFIEHDADTNGYATGINKLDRTNVGMYYQRRAGRFDMELNTVYQFGKQPSGTPEWADDTLLVDTVTSEVDIAAFLFTFELGYNFPGPRHARLAAAIDYSSGDDGSDTTKYKAYNNLYYTGHKFRGYMDYFLGSGRAGLQDIILRGKFDPVAGWTVKGDLHFFSTAQNYISPIDSSLTKDVGIEFDAVVTTTRIAGVNFAAGTSFFIPKESFAGMTDPKNGFWVWSMATVRFGN